MLIDTHAHLDFPDFDLDRDQVIERAKAQGINYIINAGSSLKGSQTGIQLSRKYEMVYASVGIHPHDAKEIEPGDFKRIEDIAKERKVVAIGEVGLDFYRNLSEPQRQLECFQKFIEIGLKCGLPLIIHSRQAEQKTLDTLRSFKDDGGWCGVIHCFSGSKSFLDNVLQLGFHISFTCNITYKKSEELKKIAALVPLEKLMLETDCPYLSPQQLRGKRNEPSNVRFLAQEIAKLRNVSLEDIAKATTENAIRLFRIEAKL